MAALDLDGLLRRGLRGGLDGARFFSGALRLPRGAEESLVTRFLTDRPLASRSCFRHNSPVRAGEASQYFGGASADHPFEFAVFD